MKAIIRMAKKEDTTQQLDIYAPFILDSAVSFELEVPDPEDYWRRIQGIQAAAPWMVCDIEDRISGFAYAGPHRNRAAYQWSRELSVYVHPEFRRKGVAQALYYTIVRILKLQGYRNVFAGIVVPNPASIAFHRQFGFKPIGVYEGVGYKMGKWQNVSWWGLTLGDLITPPGKIASLDQLSGTRAFEDCIVAGLKALKLN